MSKFNNITDVQLEEMLKDTLNSEKSSNDSNLRPPVINTYRLEKERLRREKQLLVTITSIAAVISMFSLAICGWIMTKIYSSQIHELIAKCHKTDLYLNITNIITQYNTEITVVLVSMLLLFVLSSVLSTVLLVKNKDKLLHSHQN